MIWNIEQGLRLDGETVARAMDARGRIYRTVAALLEDHDVIVAPAAQVAPFDADIEYPLEVDGVAMPNYLGWMRVCSRITVSSHPVAAVPAGFTADGLPVGIQLVGPLSRRPSAARDRRRMGGSDGAHVTASLFAVSRLTRSSERPDLTSPGHD